MTKHTATLYQRSTDAGVAAMLGALSGIGAAGFACKTYQDHDAWFVLFVALTVIFFALMIRYARQAIKLGNRAVADETYEIREEQLKATYHPSIYS